MRYDAQNKFVRNSQRHSVVFRSQMEPIAQIKGITGRIQRMNRVGEVSYFTDRDQYLSQHIFKA